jgi:hypothetical protein
MFEDGGHPQQDLTEKSEAAFGKAYLQRFRPPTARDPLEECDH